MTSVEHKETDITALISSLETFCSNLSRGLHATAQPLTILQASLSNDMLSKMSAEELRHLLRTSSSEVQRVCTYFHLLKQFVQVERSKPDLIPLSLGDLLREAIEGLDLVFQDGGIHLQLEGIETSARVLVNQARIRQALTGILLIGRAVSAEGETLEVTASTSAETVNIRVRNGLPAVRTLNEEMSLKLALVEANVRSQNGVLRWGLQPFTVDLELKRVAEA